jgi:hypothetical protein
MSNASVYTGFWTNWDRKVAPNHCTAIGIANNDLEGRISGWTLTTPPEQGRIVIALLALFVTLSGSHLWNIICLVLHQVRSQQLKANALHHQQQALLANSPSSAFVAYTSARLGWKWRKKSRNALSQAIPIALAATIYVVSVGVASAFSSHVFSTSDEVLVLPNSCGWIGTAQGFSDVTSGPPPLDLLIAVDTMGRWAASQSLKYAQTCYEQTSLTNVGSCQFYIKPAITSMTSTNTPCPFSETICGLPQAFQVDTGYIDSSRDLGINSPVEDHVQFKKVLTCVPLLAEEKFSSNWTVAPSVGQYLPGDSFKYYFLGPTSATPVLNSTWGTSNYTEWTGGPGYRFG